MFEKNPPVVPASAAAFVPSAQSFADAVEGGPETEPLRAFDWAELTARLNAARDLRRVLLKNVSGSAHDFADAAARFLDSREEHECDVNLVVLEHPKGSSDREETVAVSTSGDARED